MLGFWKHISSLGIQPHHSYSLQRRIKLTNQLSSVISMAGLLTSLFFVFVINRPIVAAGTLVVMLIYAALPWLNKKGLFTPSRLLLCLLLPVAIIGLSVAGKLYEPESIEINQYFLPRFLLLSGIALPFLLFNIREWKSLLITSLVMGVFVLSFDPIHEWLGISFYDQQPIDISTYPQINYIIMVSALVIIGCFAFFSVNNNEYEQRVLTLNRELEENAAELKIQKEKAEESVETKSAFLSNMSHEIRTPMNAVVGITNLLAQEDLTKEQKEQIDLLKFSAENLLVIINDILDFNKIDADKILLESEPLDLRELLKNVSGTLKGRATERDVSLITLSDDELPNWVLGDRVRLNQILTNLISNALKFTTQGEVRVSAELIEQGEQTASIKFSIKDTGVGIPKEKQASIFESFTQADISTTRLFGGSGLGLSITKRLIELHGSTIELESEVGKGTLFHFTLKMKVFDQEVKPALTTTKRELQPSQDIKVLVAEDNIINQKVIGKFLDRWEIRYDFVDNGEEVLNLLQNQSYDLILMDLHMPVLDGYETTRQIRASSGKVYQKVPIIALTASAMVDIKQRAYEAGVTDYVTKPFDPAELLEKIQLHAV